MKKKRDSYSEESSSSKRPIVREGASGRYARRKAVKFSLRAGITLAEAKKRLSRPVKRSEKDVKKALEIAGIGEGPEDLSENMLVYLRNK